jgi:hypothetical protein
MGEMGGWVDGDDASFEMANWEVPEERFQKLGISVSVDLICVESIACGNGPSANDDPFAERSKNALYPNGSHGLSDPRLSTDPVGEEATSAGTSPINSNDTAE